MFKFASFKGTTGNAAFFMTENVILLSNTQVWNGQPLFDEPRSLSA